MAPAAAEPVQSAGSGRPPQPARRQTRRYDGRVIRAQCRRTSSASKSIFSSTLWAAKEEYATFTGEPPRASLTEPPPGYRTPSPNQPYGVGKQKWTPDGRPTGHVPRQDEAGDRLGTAVSQRPLRFARGA